MVMFTFSLVLMVLAVTVVYRSRHPEAPPPGQGSVLWPALVEFAGHDLPATAVLLAGAMLFYSLGFAPGPAYFYGWAYSGLEIVAVLGYWLGKPVLAGTLTELRPVWERVLAPLPPAPIPGSDTPPDPQPHGELPSPRLPAPRAEEDTPTIADHTHARRGARIAWAEDLFRSRSQSIALQLERLRQQLDAAIIGQEKGKQAVHDALARAWTGTRAGKGPITALIFTGPTGVGKTEMAEALAKALGWPLKFFPLGQAGAEKGALAWKLFGPEPGYVGSQRGGELTQFLRANPESVIVFDEFEKPLQSDPTVYQSLLHLLSEGRVKDNSLSQTYDASRCVVIFTSNLLAQEPDLEHLEGAQLKAVLGAQAGLPQEFLGRIKGVVPFRALHASEVEQITKKIVTAVFTTLITHNKLNRTTKHSYTQAASSERASGEISAARSASTATVTSGV
jgi:hypothetical protein